MRILQIIHWNNNTYCEFRHLAFGKKLEIVSIAYGMEQVISIFCSQNIRLVESFETLSSQEQLALRYVYIS